MLLNDAVPHFLNSINTTRERSRDIHVERLDLFLRLYGNKHADQLSRADVLRWHRLLEERGYAPASMTGFRESVKAFVKWLINAGEISFKKPEDNPIFGLKTGSKISKRRKIPAPDALHAAVTIAEKWMLESTRPREIRDGTIFCISVLCGARAKELRRCRRSEVEAALKRGANGEGVYLIQSGGKSDETVIRVTEHEAKGLRRWLKVYPKKCRINRIFPPTRRSSTDADPVVRWRQMSRSALDDVFVRVCDAAGVPPIRPHSLRHNVGTEMAKAGENASVIGNVLNHSDANDGATTAYRFYIQTDESQVSKAIAARGKASSVDSEVDEIARLFNVIR